MQPARQSPDRQECANGIAVHEDTCTFVVSPCGALMPTPPACEAPTPEATPLEGKTRGVPDADAGPEAVCPKLLKSYLPLVHQVVATIARRLPANVLRDDLLAAGVFGLVDSLRRNGGDSGDGFEWYARTRIRGAVVDELRAQDWLTRRARAAVTRAQSGEDEGGRPAALVSLSELSPGEESLHLVALEQDPAASFEAKDQYRALQVAMEKLPPRERQIVRRHYFDGVKFKDIGVELKVSEPRVSQLHARAIGRLRSIFHEKSTRVRAATPQAPAAEPRASARVA
jgi:RNA polymerase sigma factor FliA